MTVDAAELLAGLDHSGGAIRGLLGVFAKEAGCLTQIVRDESELSIPRNRGGFPSKLAGCRFLFSAMS